MTVTAHGCVRLCDVPWIGHHRVGHKRRWLFLCVRVCRRRLSAVLLASHGCDRIHRTQSVCPHRLSAVLLSSGITSMRGRAAQRTASTTLKNLRTAVHVSAVCRWIGRPLDSNITETECCVAVQYPNPVAPMRSQQHSTQSAPTHTQTKK